MSDNQDSVMLPVMDQQTINLPNKKADTVIRFPILSPDGYQKVVLSTQQRIREELRTPDPDVYASQNVSMYPKWFERGVLGALVCVMFFSFFVSSGKQAAAMGLILDKLPDDFNHLSLFWANVSTLFMMLLGEGGTILFFIAAGTIAVGSHSVPVGRWNVNIVALIFRLFAGLCAAFALVSNITISALAPVHDASVLQWLVSIGVPLLVLGIGILLEQMIQQKLLSENEQKFKYQSAMKDYQLFMDRPDICADYTERLVDALYAEILIVANQKVQRTIGLLVTADYKNSRRIAYQEHKVHSERFDIEVDGNSTNVFIQAANS